MTNEDAKKAMMAVRISGGLVEWFARIALGNIDPIIRLAGDRYDPVELKINGIPVTFPSFIELHRRGRNSRNVDGEQWRRWCNCLMRQLGLYVEQDRLRDAEDQRAA